MDNFVLDFYHTPVEPYVNLDAVVSGNSFEIAKVRDTYYIYFTMIHI